VLTLERINEIVKRHRPRGWRVRQSRHRWEWSSARANSRTRTLSVPTLDDADSLFLYLHECGHVHQDHFKLTLPRHREEFEAERYALHVFRNEGIPVTKTILEDARVRVRKHIDFDIEHDVPIQPHIARWAKHNGYRNR
jgi:hypothetical protein